MPLARSKPGKNDRHAASDRLPVGKRRTLAHEQDRWLPGGGEMGNMRPVQVNMRGTEGRGNLKTRQSAGSRHEVNFAGNIEAGCHGNGLLDIGG